MQTNGIYKQLSLCDVTCIDLINQDLSLKDVVRKLSSSSKRIAKELHSSDSIHDKIELMESVKGALGHYKAQAEDKDHYVLINEHYLMWESNLDDFNIRVEQEKFQSEMPTYPY
ncbi:MAG: hypothetical protein KAQ83_02770 [Nanoarchaeota archaeon]|nr:hypothetical protein [Nanoarchaeota archaeon]